MTIFDMPNYLWITILGMILLTVFYTLVLNKWFQSAIITFVVLAVLAFFIPNFQNISYQPLLGYAGFLGIMSLIISLVKSRLLCKMLYNVFTISTYQN